MKILLLAAPGAGKGTQAEILSKRFNIPTISTGAILRKSISDGTELGKIAEQYINDGKFVPDDVIIGVVEERLAQEDCKDGYILDGFPRTLSQAKALEEFDGGLDYVLNIIVPDETIVERLSGRLECSECGTTYHKLHRQPKVEGICDACGGALRTREDDKPETIRCRLETYRTQTEPLISYYVEKGKVRTVYGQETIEATSAEVLKVLEVE